jgi:phospholipid/cholesterol/gamma-HCH transport system substrate-binding protein
MTTYRRNIIVGVTVLTALASLAWMVLKFGGNLASPFSPEQMFVRFRSDRADGLGTGSGIFYLGVEVGRITRIDLDPVNGGVTMTAMVNRQPSLPANVEGYIRINTFIGGSTSVMLETLGPPTGTLQPNAELVAKYVGLAVLPPELAEMAREISAAVRQYRETNVIVHIDEQVQRLGKVLDSIDSLVGDPQLREDVRQAIANLRQTSEQAQRIAGDVEKFSGNLESLRSDAAETLGSARKTFTTADEEIRKLSREFTDRLGQATQLMKQVSSTLEKIERGDGTAGALLTDRRLYEGLVDTTRELQIAIRDLQRLIRQWEQEGVPMRLR